jgi:prefoldin subunit 5
MNDKIKIKLEELVTQHNEKASQLEQVMSNMNELAAQQRALQDEILFIRGQVSALNDLTTEKDAIKNLDAVGTEKEEKETKEVKK